MKPEIKRFLTEYLAELVSGNAAIFAGAGLSVPAGYVDWAKLLQPLAAELDLNIALETDFVAMAQFHYNFSGKQRAKLNKAILEGLAGDAKSTANHDLLGQLPIDTYWTTNYDKLIETSLAGMGKIVDVKCTVPQMAFTRPHRSVTVYKMHGDVEHPDQAIITKDDYEKYARAREPFVTALAGDLVKRTFLFLGFSFTDPNLEHVLSQVRHHFADNQREHFAIFRARKRFKDESDDHFAHYQARQRHVIDDLKRFNIKILLIDEYSEVNDILAELAKLYKRRTVFIATSAADFDPWGNEAVADFARELGREMIARGSRIATGLGVGVGDAIFTGALREAMQQRLDIGEAFVLRPFPQTGPPEQLDALWEAYRQEFMSQAGIAVFLFGNKKVDGLTVGAEGMFREFEIARAQSAATIPVGATGYAAKSLADLVLADPGRLAEEFSAESREKLATLAIPTDDLKSLIPSIIDLIQELQGKV